MSAFKYTPDQVTAAAGLIIDARTAANDVIRRRLSVGYGTAGAILERLVELGIVSAGVGGQNRRVLVPPARRDAAVACVMAGHRYDPGVPVATPRDGVSTEAMTGAVGLAYSAMPPRMADPQARELAQKIVGLLVDAGWRPTRTA